MALRHRNFPLLSMNFEFLSIQYLRRIAAGRGDNMKISEYSGLRTVVDIMAESVKELGVQVYLGSKLLSFQVLDRGVILLQFSGINTVIPTSRLFLAINHKNLLDLSSSLHHISLDAGQLLGNLKDVRVQKGVVFYKDAWWRKLNLHGVIYTDTLLNKISHGLSTNCTDASCPGYMRFDNWADWNSLNLDTFNPIGLATVLTSYFSNMTQMFNNTDQVNNTHRANNNNAQKANTSDIDDIIERDTLRAKLALKFIHRLIISIHQQLPGFDASNVQEPTSAVLANWDNDGIFTYGSALLPSDISYRQFVNAVMEPIPGEPIHLVNSHISDWDEGLESSIVQVERVLNTILGMTKPDWNTDAIYSAEVKLE